MSCGPLEKLRMIRATRVMVANCEGYPFDILAYTTQRLGLLIGPTHHGWPRPKPWFPYALDNGAFTCWDQARNEFDDHKWQTDTVQRWRKLVTSYRLYTQTPEWVVVPDVPGNSTRTLERWPVYVPEVQGWCPLAIAVQDGMEPVDVLRLDPMPDVIAVGGSTDWKWGSLEMWAQAFPRVHVLRVNSPSKLEYLNGLGVESCDGTGWARSDHGKNTALAGLEAYCRRHANPSTALIAPYVGKTKPIKGTGQLEAF